MVLINLGKTNLKDDTSQSKNFATRHFQFSADYPAALPESQELWQKYLEPFICNCLHELQVNTKTLLENNACIYFMLFLCGMKTVRNGRQIYIAEIWDLSQAVTPHHGHVFET